MVSFDRMDLDPRSVSRDVAENPRLTEIMPGHVGQLASLFKALGHEGRLHILCLLTAGEKTVTELEAGLGQRQAAVSQQLARLRLEGLVSTRRAGKAIHYTLVDRRVRAVLRLLPDLATRD